MLTYQDLRQRGDIVRRLKTAIGEACNASALESCCADALVEIEKLRELAWQYRDDMRYPPAADSRERRINAINAVIGAD